MRGDSNQSKPVRPAQFDAELVLALVEASPDEPDREGRFLEACEPLVRQILRTRPLSRLDDESREDVAQEGRIALLRVIRDEAFCSSRGSVGAFFYRVARNAMADAARVLCAARSIPMDPEFAGQIADTLDEDADPPRQIPAVARGEISAHLDRLASATEARIAIEHARFEPRLRNAAQREACLYLQRHLSLFGFPRQTGELSRTLIHAYDLSRDQARFVANYTLVRVRQTLLEARRAHI